MEHALIVSSSSKGCEILTDLLKIEKEIMITTATSSSEARRILLEQEFEVVIIITPLSDEFGQELGLKIIEDTSTGVILIVKKEMADEIASKVEDDGVFVVEKPINRLLFYQAIKLVKASRNRFLKLKKENLKLQDKIKEIKVIDRAKCVLVQYLNMSEQQAHRYIEKQAMDMQLTRKVIAENILKTYES